jgi:hypothetical protein
MKDLVLLVADKNMQFALTGALGRTESLGMRPVEFEFRVRPGRDGGTRDSGPEVLALERRRFRHALLILDFEGSGADSATATALEAQLDQRLSAFWEGQAKSIVIAPELDIWVWGVGNSLETAIEWPPGINVRDWLRREGFIFDINDKPTRPKEALEAALRVPSLPRSSSLYRTIAERISLRRCNDGAFTRLREQLVEWFPKQGANISAVD